MSTARRLYGGTARHEDAVGGSVFEGKFRERVMQGCTHPMCHVACHTAAPLLELSLLL